MELEILVNHIIEKNPELTTKDVKHEYYTLMKERIDKMEYKADEYNATSTARQIISENYATKCMLEKYNIGNYFEMVANYKRK